MEFQPYAKAPMTGSGMALGGAGRGQPMIPTRPMPAVDPSQIANGPAPMPAPGQSGMTPPKMGVLPNGNPFPGQGQGVGGLPVSAPPVPPAAPRAPGIVGNASPGQSGMAPPRTGTLPNGNPFPGQGHAWGLNGGNPQQGFGSPQQRHRMANALMGGAFRGR